MIGRVVYALAAVALGVALAVSNPDQPQTTTGAKTCAQILHDNPSSKTCKRL